MTTRRGNKVMDINPSYQMSPEIALYLQKLQEQKNRMVNPDYMAREDDRGDQGTFSAPSGIAALGQAFSQLGTISGKSSDTGALQANAAALNQQAAQDKKMDLARQDARDKQTGLQLSVLQHLNDKQLASQEAANRLKADQDFKLQQADAERQFRADQASKDRELKSQLAEESNSVRKDLAAAQKPKVTADEHTAAYHASRAEDAADLLGQIEKSGYDPSDYGRAARSFKIPFLDAKPLQSQADRAYKQAQVHCFCAS
jgi:hypothetical protein